MNEQRFIGPRCSHRMVQFLERGGLPQVTNRLVVCISCRQLIQEYAEVRNNSSEREEFRDEFCKINSYWPVQLMLLLIVDAIYQTGLDRVGSQEYDGACRKSYSTENHIKIFELTLLGNDSLLENQTQISCQDWMESDCTGITLVYEFLLRFIAVTIGFLMFGWRVKAAIGQFDACKRVTIKQVMTVCTQAYMGIFVTSILIEFLELYAGDFQQFINLFRGVILIAQMKVTADLFTAVFDITKVAGQYFGFSCVLIKYLVEYTVFYILKYISKYHCFIN